MYQSARELWVAFFAIVIITLVYLTAVIMLGGVPAASSLFGHSLGILGFTLMFMTETLYTLRKRSRSARWGRVSSWLNFHIVTGLVGPYLVLLHSSWKFNGLAGIVMLMTLVVVISGFIGRYIYTAIPRNVDGLEIESGELQRRIYALELEINGWIRARPALSKQMLNFATVSLSTPTPGINNPFGNLSYRWSVWNIQRKLDAESRAQIMQLAELVKRQRDFTRQRVSLAQARRLMALWHTLHVPIGLALFTAAFIHIVAAVYYATLLR
jgi:hypothetical protein